MDKATARKIREANKAVFIARYAIETQIMCMKCEFAAIAIAASRSISAQAMAHTPAWCWRTDKPKVDKRRLRRFSNSLNRGYKLKPLLEQNFNLEVA